MRPRQRIPLRIHQGRHHSHRPSCPGSEVEEEADRPRQLHRDHPPQSARLRHGRIIRGLRSRDDVSPVEGGGPVERGPGVPGGRRRGRRFPGFRAFRSCESQQGHRRRCERQRGPGRRSRPEVLRQGDPSDQPVSPVQQRSADPGAQRQRVRMPPVPGFYGDQGQGRR